jgi:perosamine synthetase
MFCITVDPLRFGHDRDRLAAALESSGIETRPFFYPVHRLPPYAGLHDTELPITDRVAASGLNLPTYSGLTDGDLDRVADAIRSVHTHER